MRQSAWVRYLALLAVTASAIAALIFHQRRAYPALPYHDSFARHEASEWTPLGGYWSVIQDEMINRSDEPGAKLVTGSPLWSNYAVDLDLQLRAHGGDVGTMLRVNDPQVGINAYRGYYVGLRSIDSAVVTGRADNDWLEGRPVPMSGGVQFGVWYHITAVVVGCEIAVRATNLGNNETTFAAFRDDPRDCIPAGKVGLRSTDTSGAWKDVRIRAASESDLNQMLQHVSLITGPEFPIREDDFSRMRMKYFPNYPHLNREAPAEDSLAIQKLPLVPIESLQMHNYTGEQIRIQGAVTLTDPVYLQDATGGVILRTSAPDLLNIGDEVEVAGQIAAGGFSPVFAVNSIHLLRDRSSVSPVSITATEAASGAHAGMLVEVTGVVQKRTRLPNGGIFLELEDPAQNFAARLKSDLFNDASKNWTVGSTIRVRGICTMNPEAESGRSFTILVAAVSDVSVIAGPPWWSGWRLVQTVAMFLLAGIAGVYLFFRVEHSKHRAIMQEREQLAHEMHDTLAQSFAGVGYYLQSIRRSLRNASQLPSGVIQELDVACEMVTETHKEASASIAALHPESNEDGDLLSLLQRSTFSMLGGGRIPIVLCREGNPLPLSPTVTDALFHVGREAISNVLRHAEATTMTLALSFQSKFVVLTIKDDGSGFDQDAQRDGFGLQSMRRRCEVIDAELMIQSSPGAGCTVSVHVPTRDGFAVTKWLRGLFG